MFKASYKIKFNTVDEYARIFCDFKFFKCLIFLFTYNEM